mgnify:CR=1 FL=1
MVMVHKNSIVFKILLSAFLSVFGILRISQCRKVTDPVLFHYPPADTATFIASDEDFPNPERGFFTYSETYADDYQPLDPNELKTARTEQQQANGGNFKIYSTLVYRYFILRGFNDKPLSQDLLDKINADFGIARQAGVKLIIRFAYTTVTHSGNCPDVTACPPYGDAPKQIVLEHISQLKPVLQSNADVIAALQMGFIGIWGENYYTDYFGDASGNGNGKYFDSNWKDRIDVLRAELDALPADRMVQVRFPQMKQRYVYGVDAPTNSAPLTDAEAFTGSDKARIGLHDDCFISSADDVGTYQNYGNSNTERGGGTADLKLYAQKDNFYVVVGGETCSNLYTPQNSCEAEGGGVQTELSAMHFSFLNSAYDNDLNNMWQDGGCMDNIRKNLGYRLVLIDAIFPTAGGTPGHQMQIQINLKNVGYASPFNPRVAKLVMKNTSTGKEFVYHLATNVQKWFPGNVSIKEMVQINSDMPSGKYALFLFLPDPYESLANRPEYAVRFANQDVWDSTTGYNNLKSIITIH